MSEITILQMIFSVISGFVVGFSLGLIGGGGSILAVPLLLYFVGLASMPDAAHLALGTTALAVGLNAYINSYMHIRKRNVAPRIGAIFTATGLAGSLIGAYLGHITPGEELLLYFSLAMIILGIYVALSKRASGSENCPIDPALEEARRTCFGLSVRRAINILSAGFIVGLVSGYFGIGGGFLVVPALVFSSKICMRIAVGTSLISVGTFGLATSLVYAYYGEVLYMISILYLLGGLLGGHLGTSLAVKIPNNKLRVMYGAIIVVVGIYVMLKALRII